MSFAPKSALQQEKPILRSPEEAEIAQKNEDESMKSHEFQTRQEQLEYLRLADPLAYENLVAKGELEHAREESQGIEA